jgi:uridine phosphorylase
MVEPLSIPCIIFPLRREALPFRRRLRPNLPVSGVPCHARLCGPPSGVVLVVETGIGRWPTEAALNWLLGGPLLIGDAHYRPQFVISAGFCGALADGYHVGDVLLATEVSDISGRVWKTTWPGTERPGKAMPKVHKARLLTVSRLVTLPDEKTALGNLHGAAAVDMEGAFLAECCSRHGVAFGVVRVVSDEAQTPLSPQLVSVFTSNRVSAWQISKAVALSPRLAAELCRLARHTRLAARQLGTALWELLQTSLEP